MNDMQIYELVAKTPRISASELANALNVDLKAMSLSLRLLVDVGDLAKSTRFGELGRQCQVYELTDEFRRSRAGKDLLVGIGNEAAAAPAPAPEHAETVKSPAAAPASAAPPAAIGSKVDRAIACITKLGAATEDQLRDAMGLTAKAYPGSYLAQAMRSGRVARDGDRWKLGTGKPQLSAKQLVHDQGSVVRVGNVIVATRDSTQVPAEVKAAVSELRKPAPVDEAIGARSEEYRVGIWSDGTIELQLNGEEVVRMTEGELAIINEFMAERRAA